MNGISAENDLLYQLTSLFDFQIFVTMAVVLLISKIHSELYEQW